MFNPGPLSAHTDEILGGVASHAEIGKDCKACHTAPWESAKMADRCAVCHTEIATEMQSVASMHGKMSHDNPNLSCRHCHPEHRGADAQLTIMDSALFPHEAVGYSLYGHRQTTAGKIFVCDDCHNGDITTFASDSCQTCHSQIDLACTFIRPPYHELRHPLIFYYGHPAVLYYNKIRLAVLASKPIDLYLEKILETGVDEMSWDDMSKNQMQWPSVKAVHEYRKKVSDFVVDLIKTHPDLEPSSNRNLDLYSPLWSLFMGFEHEKIHFETSSVLIRELPLELLETPKYWAPLHPSAAGKTPSKPAMTKDYPAFQWVPQKGATVQWGKPTSAPSSDFQDYDAYVEALAEWKAEQKVTEALERRQQSSEQAKKAAEAREIAKSWSERQNAARSVFADYDAVVGSADVIITPAVSDILLTSDKGPEVAYYLAKNPSVVERLNSLSPTAAAREIGRLEAALEKPSAKHVVDAPAPASITRSARTQSSDLAQLDHEAYRAARAKQGAVWARR